MSRQELIGHWVEKRQEALAIAGQKRAELAILKDRIIALAHVLGVRIEAEAGAWFANNTIPTQEQFTGLFSELRKANEDAGEANEQLRNLGIR